MLIDSAEKSVMAKLIFPSSENAQKASRLAAQGRLHRIRNGIYTDTSDSEEITKTLNSKWMDVACKLFDGPVAVARTASELKPAGGRLYFVSSKLKAPRTTQVGHLVFHISPGDTDHGVEQIHLEMSRGNPARYCLENLAPSRGNKNSRKTLGPEWVELELIKHIRRGGEQAVNALRDEACELAPTLKLKEEFEKLDALIAALLRTHPTQGILQTRLGEATAEGEPFDQSRIEKFAELARYLNKTDLKESHIVIDHSDKLDYLAEDHLHGMQKLESS